VRIETQTTQIATNFTKWVVERKLILPPLSERHVTTRIRNAAITMSQRIYDSLRYPKYNNDDPKKLNLDQLNELENHNAAIFPTIFRGWIRVPMVPNTKCNLIVQGEADLTPFPPLIAIFWDTIDAIRLLRKHPQ